MFVTYLKCDISFPVVYYLSTANLNITLAQSPFYFAFHKMSPLTGAKYFCCNLYCITFCDPTFSPISEVHEGGMCNKWKEIRVEAVV
jgi:hypothetical protein